jgi:hypothetical protein
VFSVGELNVKQGFDSEEPHEGESEKSGSDDK